MTSAVLPAERLQDEELLVIRESARLMGKSLEPGLVIREMLHLISEFLGLNRGRVVLQEPGGGDFAIRYAYGLTEAEIAQYWETGEPQDKAGAYAIQGRGAVFIAALEGSYSGVMGLPLFETAGLLAAAGIPCWEAAGA